MTNRHFEDKGADYARFRPTYPPELAAALANVSERRDTGIDVGCGNGQLSVLLAEHFGEIIASDVSADQIANAAPCENIRYVTGSAEHIDAPDGSANLITAAQAAHWFDLDAFYAEARRIAAPGAVVALITYGVFHTDGPAAERINRFYWDEIHPHWPKGREHVETGYSGFEFPFAPVEMPKLSIKRIWTAAELLNYCTTWSAVKRAEKAGAGHVFKAFKTELNDMLGPEDKINVEWPISIRAGRL